MKTVFFYKILIILNALFCVHFIDYIILSFIRNFPILNCLEVSA
jgi:hypothetical protein